MATPDWTREAGWDELYLGGTRMPGVARIEVNLPTGLNVRKARGAKKARVFDTGSGVSKLSIELVMSPAHISELEAVIPMLRSKAANSTQEKLVIRHPQTALWGINVVKIGEINAPMPTAGGFYRVSIKAVEHVDEPKAVKKPKAKAKDVTDEDVNDAINKLRELPGRSGAAERNFSDPDEPVSE